jgi:hypothetical protein
MNKFWTRVENCKHEKADYTSSCISCGTPYCDAHEEFCPECRVFILKCQCGFCSGMSGWSEMRWRRYRRKKGINEW